MMEITSLHRRLSDCLSSEGRIAFKYCDDKGVVSEVANPNGSASNIAGILNERKNVLGMMPHPERLADPALGGIDGRSMFEALAGKVFFMTDETPITNDTIAEHGLTQDEYSKVIEILGRNPNLIELGIFSVMWSEHCSYKSSRHWLKRLPTEALCNSRTWRKCRGY